MSRWCAVKVRIDCPECGSPVLVDGPYKKALCQACGSRIAVANIWRWIVERAFDDGATGNHFNTSTLMQAGRGVGNIYVGLNHGHPPICPQCDDVLDQVDTTVPDGTDGMFQCPGCGTSHPTWPAPGYLKQVKIVQVFLAPPEEQQGNLDSETGGKPVIFGCPNCGANLKIGSETRRISTCEYCEVDMYLPADLWNRLHPIRRRRAFWMRCT